jgi:hypothetical protein
MISGAGDGVADFRVAHERRIHRIVVKGDFDDGCVELAVNIGVIDFAEFDVVAIECNDFHIEPVVFELAVLREHVVFHFLTEQVGEQLLMWRGGSGNVVAVVQTQHSAATGRIRMEAHEHTVVERAVGFAIHEFSKLR